MNGSMDGVGQRILKRMSETEHRSDRVRLLSQALESGSLYQVRQMIKTLPPAGIAHLLESSPPKARAVLWQLLDKDVEGEVIQSLNEDLQGEFLREYNAAEVAELGTGLEPDDLADILQQLPRQVAAEALQAMDEQDRQRVETVLSHAEDTAGGLMNIDTITVRKGHSVELVLRYLRRHDAIPEMTDNIHVVNRQDIFLGILPLRELLVADPAALVMDIMRADIEAIPVAMPAQQVAHLFEQHGWVSAPVVDERGKLVGRITIDDVVDVIRDSSEHPLMGMAGLDEEHDTFAPALKTARRRALWLGINLVAAALAAFVIYLFQDVVDRIVYLAVLMPIVANMGGVAGTQTLTLVIRSIALGHIGPSNSAWLVIRELNAALLNGLVWALAMGLIAMVWYNDLRLALIAGIAMMINLVSAALTGAYLPLFLRRVNLDPALAGSVILHTLTDSIGFFAVLVLAEMFYLSAG